MVAGQVVRRVPTRWLCAAVLLLAPLATHAQVRPDSAAKPPAARDSSVRDSAAIARAAADSVRNALAQARVDSVYRAKLVDTIKAPLAHFEKPDQPELHDRLTFNRQEIMSSGAVTLADVLDRVPGVTTYRSRWLAGLHTAAYNGDFQRVRVFFDGVERDAIEARNGGVLDLTDIPIFTLDEIRIERTAGEVRVWLRGWTVRRTTPFTRVDIVTGDLNTNGFRGLFGKRFSNGLSFQFVGQQMASQSGRVSAFTASEAATGSGDGDVKYVDLRLGWARGRITADVHGIASSRTRDPQTARKDFTNLPAFKGARREGYARLAYGDSLQGLWSHVMVGALRTRLSGIASTAADRDTTLSADTSRTRMQQIVAVGYRTPRWHVSLLDRMRPVSGTVFHAPAIRAGIGTERFGALAYVERRALDSLHQREVSLWARPTSWLRVVVSQSNREPQNDTLKPAFGTTRAEAAVRFKRLWFGGGVIREGATTYASPVLFTAPAATLPSTEAIGLMGSVRGALYKDISYDMQIIKWDAAQYSRPTFSLRNEVALQTNWLSRFPKGEFTINLRLIHDVREPVPFFWSGTPGQTQRVADDAQVVTALLEIRIQSATLFYQYRNLTGRAYEQLPGLTMPPAVQIYGVRWDFWN